MKINFLHIFFVLLPIMYRMQVMIFLNLITLLLLPFYLLVFLYLYFLSYALLHLLLLFYHSFISLLVILLSFWGRFSNGHFCPFWKRPRMDKNVHFVPHLKSLYYIFLSKTIVWKNWHKKSRHCLLLFSKNCIDFLQSCLTYIAFFQFFSCDKISYRPTVIYYKG